MTVYLIVECPPEFYSEPEEVRHPDGSIRAAKDGLKALRALLSK